MNVLSGFSLSLLQVVVGLLNVYTWVVIARALVSWVNPDPRNPIVRFLVLATEPVLRPFRKLVPPHKTGGLDLSPLLVILLLQFVKNGLIYSYGFRPRIF
ncbi:MAG TPA: YggT family protein [Thermoanaerobaculia bacterium]|nr:YggT family protein [Thermoanaerobaculia bacterium]